MCMRHLSNSPLCLLGADDITSRRGLKNITYFQKVMHETWSKVKLKQILSCEIFAIMINYVKCSLTGHHNSWDLGQFIESNRFKNRRLKGGIDSPKNLTFSHLRTN